MYARIMYVCMYVRIMYMHVSMKRAHRESDVMKWAELRDGPWQWDEMGRGGGIGLKVYRLVPHTLN